MRVSPFLFLIRSHCFKHKGTNFHESDLFIRVDSSDSWAILAVEPSLRSLRSFAVQILDAALPR